MLVVEHIEVVYEDIIVALRGISLKVPKGAIVALLGANGSGKTTTLKAISGLLPAERGRLAGGTVSYLGRLVGEQAPRDLVRSGLVQVLEGRHCFPHLTVEENLQTGALAGGAGRREVKWALERVYAYFPRLKTRRHLPCGYASGGEQQMVAVGRALMGRPKLVLLDEPSIGLAPQVVAEIFEIVRELNRKEGTSFLLAEQNVKMALRYADFGYVLETGRVAARGPAVELAARADVKDLYLGGGAGASAAERVRRRAGNGVTTLP